MAELNEAHFMIHSRNKVPLVSKKKIGRRKAKRTIERV